MIMTQALLPIDGVIYPTQENAEIAYSQKHWLRMTAGNLVRNFAKTSPEKIFIVTDESKISYAEFDARTEILAGSLLDLGLRPGDRAIFQMGTVPETLIALFACYKSGIVPVCTLPQHREVEIDTMIHLTQAKAYFVQADFDIKFDLVSFAHATAKRTGHVEHIIVARGNEPSTYHSLEKLSSLMTEDQARARLSDILIDPKDVITFQLSGGSTSVPKIIPRFHAEYLGQANSIVMRYQFTKSEVAIWPLPLVHNAAMLLIVLPMLLSGGTIVLQRKFILEDFLSAIKHHAVSFAGSIGPIAPSLLSCKNAMDHMPSLRMFFALDRADAIEEHLKIPTVNLYGITEGLLMTCNSNDPAILRFKTVGYPTCSSDQIKVLVPKTEEPAALGSEGELCFRGPHTLLGYYNAPEVTMESFTSDGFFRTGDLVRAESYKGQTAYIFLGRLKDNISRGGEKFSSEEVESLIVLHPAIADVKVVAMPDQYLGEKACAFVILRAGHKLPTVQDLDIFLIKKGLARYKHPERIEALDAFPLTRVGKTDKVALRKLINTMLQGHL